MTLLLKVALDDSAVERNREEQSQSKFSVLFCFEVSNLFRILDSGTKSVMGLLWSVTDRDIDRFTLRLYNDWFQSPSNSSKEQGPCLSRFINESGRG